MHIGHNIPSGYETTLAEPQSAGVETLRRLGLDVHVDPEVAHTEQIGSAEITRGLDIHGLVHISETSKNQFEEAKTGRLGKFGDGTYFAAGNLTGETYNLLKVPGNVLHSATVDDVSVLFVDRSQVRLLDDELKMRAGIPESKLKTTIQNANLTDHSRQAGLEVDAVVIFMDEERTAAEIVVLPHATSRISITDRREL